MRKTIWVGAICAMEDGGHVGGGNTRNTSGAAGCIKAGLSLEMPGKLLGKSRILNLFFKISKLEY